MRQRQVVLGERELDGGAVEHGAHHLDEMVQSHGAPDIVGEVYEIGGPSSEGPGVGEYSPSVPAILRMETVIAG